MWTQSDRGWFIKVNIILCMLSVDSIFAINVASVANSWGVFTRASQKVRSSIFYLFLGNTETNYQGENVQEVCLTTL